MNFKIPAISIVTPSYNQSQYLEQTILSVLDQNYPNLEYIIIDGGSTDASVSIIKKYEKHLKFWLSEKDKGQSHAINKGLQRVTGEIVNWLNSDDYYEPNTLSLIAKAFEDPEVNIVSARSRLFKGNGDTVGYSKGVDVYPDNLAKTIGWARIDQPETFFRLNAIKKIGLLDEGFHYIMDRNWWIKYLFSFGLGGIKQISDVVVNFRLHETSKTVSQRESFQVEHDSLFYGLAVKSNLEHVSQLIQSTCTLNKKITFQYNGELSKYLIEQVMNYYLLLRANEFYATDKKQQAQQFLNHVKLDMLVQEDKALWRKLYFRNKYLPHFFIQLLRKT